jgi:predicted esterase YcpF (UPF0227 family)
VGTDATGSLVWVHGIPSTDTDSQRSEFLSKYFPNVAISELQLLSDNHDEITHPTFLRHKARQMLEELLRFTEDGAVSRPIVLIGENLGGFLVKQASNSLSIP